MIAANPKIIGPDVLVPGSDFLLAGLGRLLLLIGVLVAVIALITRTVKRRRHPEVERRRPTVTIVSSVFATIGLVLTVLYWPPPFFTPTFPPLPQLLPDGALFYRPIDDLPVAADSDRWIAAQEHLELGSGFGSVVHDGVVWGNPFNLVNLKTPMVDVHLVLYPDSSFPGPYPITDPPYIESMPTYGIDQHYLAVDLDRRHAWELFTLRRWFWRWEADSGATWSMDSLNYPEGSTIAAGLPMLPGTVTYDEVADGGIAHAILGATPTSYPGQFIWPARGSDGTSTNPNAPPMGAWFRLKADTDLSELGPQAKVIAEAAKQYGIILSDTAPGFGLRGTADKRWDEVDLKTLDNLTTDDFEIVDVSSIVVSPDSMEARPR